MSATDAGIRDVLEVAPVSVVQRADARAFRRSLTRIYDEAEALAAGCTPPRSRSRRTKSSAEPIAYSAWRMFVSARIRAREGSSATQWRIG